MASSTSTSKTSKPYGLWTSPLTVDVALTSAVKFADVLVAGANGVAWLEGRPEEGGRQALVYKAGDGKAVDVLPKDVNARTRVHEYGGASASLLGEGRIIYGDFSGPAYETKLDGGAWSKPKEITPKDKPFRYADFTAHPSAPDVVLAVLEDHTIDEPAKVVNSLVAIDTKTQSVYPVAEGADFYAAGRFSPDGKWVCWLQWLHPNMPWEASQLLVAKVKGTNPADLIEKDSIKVIAGKKQGSESISQPRWDLESNTLVFLSDVEGFYELYSWSADDPSGKVSLVLPELLHKDVGGPDWVLGASTHGPAGKGKWVAAAGAGKLQVIDLASQQREVFATPFVSISTLRVLPGSNDEVLVIGSPWEAPDEVAILTLASSSSTASKKTLKVASPASISASYISKGKLIEFPSKGGATAYARFYPPTNGDYSAPSGEKPPLVVRCHGGPTSAAAQGLDFRIQLMTSRGFAFADVDYGGSTGYGRTYRARLDGEWGVVDVTDVSACVTFLASTGEIDPKRVAITGGSAGGYTVLAALCDTPEVFTAGASFYGISDLMALAGDTHKFESQYLYKLLGGTPEQVPAVYHDRSPIHKASSITAPLLLLQGSEDRVVPLSQATKMAETIKAAGGKAELIVFEGEGHGFRRLDSQKKSIEAELAFYAKTWAIA